MKTIKIKFSGMGEKFNFEKNFITDILKKYYVIEFSDNPDYLIYSVKSKDYLNYNCIRIYYTPENLVPDFNICDYAIGFHYLNFGDRYIRFPIYLVDSYNDYEGDDYGLDLTRAMHKHENVKSTLSKKTDFCSFVYSNDKAAPCRALMFDALSKYKQINSGGRYLNNVGGPINSKLEFQLKHKFAIAFENTATSGYTTEKIVHAFSAGTIPIYWGNPDISKEFNSDSFINCCDYGLTEKGEADIIDKIVKKVIWLDQNDDAYLQMLETPAFTPANDVAKQLSSFENFILAIFEQEPNDAYRRNRYYWGERYERKQKIGNEFYWQCRKLIPIRDGIKNIFKKK